MTRHYLTWLLNEDEAQTTGLCFEVEGDTVTVTETFHDPAYAAWALAPKRMSREEARELWKRLVRSGEYVA